MPGRTRALATVRILVSIECAHDSPYLSKVPVVDALSRSRRSRKLNICRNCSKYELGLTPSTTTTSLGCSTSYSISHRDSPSRRFGGAVFGGLFAIVVLSWFLTLTAVSIRRYVRLHDAPDMRAEWLASLALVAIEVSGNVPLVIPHVHYGHQHQYQLYASSTPLLNRRRCRSGEAEVRWT